MKQGQPSGWPLLLPSEDGSDRRPILEHRGCPLLLLRAGALLLALLLGRGMAAALLRRGFRSGHHTAPMDMALSFKTDRGRLCSDCAAGLAAPRRNCDALAAKSDSCKPYATRIYASVALLPSRHRED